MMTEESPTKKRRTLRDAEAELKVLRSALMEAKRRLVVTARENAKMKVLLMKYIEKDDSLLCTSQLSASESSSEPTTSVTPTSEALLISPLAVETEALVLSQSPLGYTTAEDGEDKELLHSDFQSCGDGFTEPVSQLSQISHTSEWSELSSTSNLDAIINFLETQDTSETNRMETLQTEYAKLKDQRAVVRVGVGVLLLSKKYPNCVLIGQRKGSHGEGKVALPGGHLEMFETWEQCALREVKEETDLDLQEATFATVTNDPMENEGKHYITIFMQAVVDDKQIVRNMERHKCVGWSWVPWVDLRSRSDMFTPLYHATHSTFTPTFIKH